MVKTEKQSSEESGSDSDVPQTPLAASTQKSPPRRDEDDESEDDDKSNGSEDYQPASQESVTSAAPKSVKDTMEKYLSKFPYVRPSKSKYSVDIDLTDSDDEIWIIRCPTSVDAKKVLLNANVSSGQSGEAAEIQSPQTGKQLEGFIAANSAKKPVTIMAGEELKSFVPSGTIQIREALGSEKNVSKFIKQEGRKSSDDQDLVPFPEVLRDRHPLLGLHYKSALKLPKRVKKALSLAQQRANAYYLQKYAKIDANVKEEAVPKKHKKRKRADVDFSSNCTTDEIIQRLIKDEAQSPPKKKVKKERKTTATTDEVEDLSWLQNI